MECVSGPVPIEDLAKHIGQDQTNTGALLLGVVCFVR